MKNMSIQNFAGILEMETCGVNSQWLKDEVLKQSNKFFNKSVMDKLSNIIQPHQLGVDDIDFN